MNLEQLIIELLKHGFDVHFKSGVEIHRMITGEAIYPVMRKHEAELSGTVEIICQNADAATLIEAYKNAATMMLETIKSSKGLFSER